MRSVHLRVTVKEGDANTGIFILGSEFGSESDTKPNGDQDKIRPHRDGNVSTLEQERSGRCALDVDVRSPPRCDGQSGRQFAAQVVSTAGA